MTKVWTVMIPTFQRSIAGPSTNMLSFEFFTPDTLVDGQEVFSATFGGESFGSSSLTRATMFTTLVSATVQCHTAGSHAPRWLVSTAVTD